MKKIRQVNRSRKLSLSVLVIAALLLGVVLAVRSSQQRQENRSQASAATFKPRGTYTNWKWSTEGSAVHTTLDTYLTIESDPTKAHPGIGYYWASQFRMVVEGGYMGIQTQGEAGDYRGKVAIFALWGADQVENGSPGSNCFFVASNFDGGDAQTNGSSCRIPLNWQAGDRYRLRVKAISENSTHRTWQATVRNQSTGQELIIGNIKTRLSYGKIYGWVSNWTEFYSAGRAECDAPYSKVIFGNPMFDMGTPAVSHINDFGGAEGACNNSKITDLAPGVRQEQGNPAATGVLPLLPTGGTYISDMEWLSATTGYGEITKDQSVTHNGSINFAGKTFAKGIGTHAVSEIKYRLDRQFSRFVSYVNMQYGGGGSITYEVWADGIKLYDSGIMNGGTYTKTINVDVTGKNELRLLVTDAGDGIGSDWAGWADARLIEVAVQPSPTPSQIPTTAPTLIPPTPFSTIIPTPSLTGLPSISVPTNIPTAIPTSALNSTRVSLNILLHGIGRGGDSSNTTSGGNANPQRTQRNISIELYNTQNQPVLTKSGVVDFNSSSGNFLGSIDLGMVTTGAYTVKVKVDQFLKVLVPGIQTITSGQVNILPQTILITGDMNNDNKIDVLDYNNLMDCYSDLTPASDCSNLAKKTSTDITDDGSVNQFDYNLFLRELTNIRGE